jgi:hypothetical protein
MATDRYTKIVLTVIAVCLLWLCVKPIFEPAKVSAAEGIQLVRIVGWRTTVDDQHTYTASFDQDFPSPLPVKDIK